MWFMLLEGSNEENVVVCARKISEIAVWKWYF